MFLLCSPHNPVGRVWSKEELRKIGEICKKNNVVVFSDEIHFDFIWEGEHNVFQEVNESFREFTITATAASKTFNLAGLQQSNLFIPNPALLRKFRHAYNETGLDEPNIAGIAAVQAAYEHGDEWFDGVRNYIRSNIEYAFEYVKNELPGVKMNRPQGTYLIWLDFRELGLSPKDLEDMIVKKAGLWLDRGRVFGDSGEGYERINVACPRKTLEEALRRIKSSI